MKASDDRRQVAIGRIQKIAKGMGALLEGVTKSATAGEWGETIRGLQAAESWLHAVRSDVSVAAFDKRPEQPASSYREISRVLAISADALDDPSTTPAVRARLEAKIGRVALANARANARDSSKDAVFRRTALLSVIDDIARRTRKGPWPKPQRWAMLAHEVIRVYGAIDPSLVPLMKQHVDALATAIEGASNVGGRGRRAAVKKSASFEALCSALKLPPATFDSSRTKTRRDKK